jgi:4-alpha-glucanotransferase
MPVFRWHVLKAQGYVWWVERLRKNMELYDLLRLDHFRGFADYWEMPASESTAVNGEWIPGPGADFFKTLQTELDELPFVAEDLGKINQAVYKLRDQFALPGMHVIQFAFGKDMPKSINILHNHTVNSIAYTGTHDNNTCRGGVSSGGRAEAKSATGALRWRACNGGKRSSDADTACVCFRSQTGDYSLAGRTGL